MHNAHHVHSTHAQDGFLQRIADLGLALAIPVHMHISMNALVTDYLPKAARGETLSLGCCSQGLQPSNIVLDMTNLETQAVGIATAPDQLSTGYSTGTGQVDHKARVQVWGRATLQQKLLMRMHQPSRTKTGQRS